MRKYFCTHVLENSFLIKEWQTGVFVSLYTESLHNNQNNSEQSINMQYNLFAATF